MDNLDMPLTETEVVEKLKRNLRPEIRHEILNIPVRTVERLMEKCRRRESFLEDVRKSQGYQKVGPFRKQVSELVEDIMDAEEFSEGEINGEVSAVALICWNCRKEGHQHKQCRMKRKVYCFGCGALNNYQPTCPQCQKKRESEHFQQSTAVRCSEGQVVKRGAELVRTIQTFEKPAPSTPSDPIKECWPNLVAQQVVDLRPSLKEKRHLETLTGLIGIM